jgi:hypothetical protein
MLIRNSTHRVADVLRRQGIHLIHSFVSHARDGLVFPATSESETQISRRSAIGSQESYIRGIMGISRPSENVMRPHPMRAQSTSRRDLMKIGLWGSTGLSLSNLLRARADARSDSTEPRETSVVWLWLQGGAPHIETFDPRMSASSDYRSMVGAISTSLPGIDLRRTLLCWK